MLLKTVAVNMLVRLRSVLSIANPQKGIKQSISIFLHTYKQTNSNKKNLGRSLKALLSD